MSNTNTITFEKFEYANNDRAASLGQFSLDLPKMEQYQNTFEFGGWLLQASDEKIESIDLSMDSQVLARARINIPRPDVSTDNPLCGFHIQCSIDFLPPAFSLEVCANILDRNDTRRRYQISLATLYGSFQSVEYKVPSKRKPLLVTGMGRSGTTLLMKLLLSNKEISGDNVYPFETRPAVYHMHQYQLTAGVADYEFSLSPDEFECNQFRSGRNPYFHQHFLLRNGMENTNRYLIEGYKRNLKRHAVCVIDEIYDAVDKDYRKSNTRYFAEKVVPSTLQYGFYQVYEEVKEIFIVRDFRDVLASAMSFNEMRQVGSFGRQHVDSDKEWVDRWSTHILAALVNGYRNRKHSVLLVRYEDLIQDTKNQLKIIYDYLEIDFDEEQANTAYVLLHGDNEHGHITSKSVIDSIGRWREDLPVEIKEYCALKLGECLDVFGYEV